MPQGPQFTEFEGARLAYEVRGHSERAVVFIHGWSGDRSHWHHQVEGLTLERRLVTLDLLGHGDSDAPEGRYDFEHLADGVAAVMDAARVPRAVLVGHSNGVLVARAFACRYPARTEGLVFVDGSLRNTLSPGVVAWMKQMLAGDNFEGARKMMAAQTPRGGLSDDDHRRVVAGTLRTPQHVHLGGLLAMTAPATWREDPIDGPLLVVMAESRQLGDDYEEFVRRLAPQTEYHEWPDVGHAIQMERPDEFNRLLEDFLSRH